MSNADTTPWHRMPRPVMALFHRLKAIEHADGSWPGTDVVDEVTAWLTSHGIDPGIDADEVRWPDDDDPDRYYRRLVEVECSSPFDLDEDDLDTAILNAVTGTGVRVELAETSETVWVELDAAGFKPVPPHFGA